MVIIICKCYIIIIIKQLKFRWFLLHYTTHSNWSIENIIYCSCCCCCWCCYFCIMLKLIYSANRWCTLYYWLTQIYSNAWTKLWLCVHGVHLTKAKKQVFLHFKNNVEGELNALYGMSFTCFFRWIFQTVNYIGWCALVGIFYTAFPFINRNSTANKFHFVMKSTILSLWNNRNHLGHEKLDINNNVNIHPYTLIDFAVDEIKKFDRKSN